MRGKISIFSLCHHVHLHVIVPDVDLHLMLLGVKEQFEPLLVRLLAQRLGEDLAAVAEESSIFGCGPVLL